MNQKICNLSHLLGEYESEHYRHQLEERLRYFSEQEKSMILRDLKMEFLKQFKTFRVRQLSMAEGN